VKGAIISIEDKKFYKHRGVDFKAIVRAAVAMIKNQKITQGGSTITQQLARTVFLSNEKSWERKVEEIFIAVGLERKYSKEQILEFYLNNIYFANGYYGIEAAARGYFNKGVAELSLADQAMLCGIPNNPTIYDPVENPDNAVARRNRILKQMYEDGKILQDTYDEQTQQELKLNRPKRKKYDYVETYTYYCATRALMEMNGFEFRNDFADQAEKDAYDEATRLLVENREILDRISDHLYEKETITGKEFMKIFREMKDLPDPDAEQSESAEQTSGDSSEEKPVVIRPLEEKKDEDNGV